MKRTDQKRREQRIRRSRAKIYGTETRPRLTVFRSNKSLYLQLIDDVNGKTLASVSTREVKEGKGAKTDQSTAVGVLLAEKAKNAGIASAVFDRRFYKYHGRVKAAAEGARAGGLKI